MRVQLHLDVAGDISVTIHADTPAETAILGLLQERGPDVKLEWSHRGVNAETQSLTIKPPRRKTREELIREVQETTRLQKGAIDAQEAAKRWP